MTYNIQLQIAGFLVILILVVIFFSKRRLRSFQNRIFSILLVDTLIELAFDIASVCTIVNRHHIPAEINMFFSRGYLVAMISFVYLIDIYALANTLYENMPSWRRKTKQITAALLTSFALFSVIFILISELKFAGEGFAVYSYGPASDMVYLFSGVSVGFVILILLFNCRHVPFKRQLSIYTFCIMEGSVAIVQMFNRELLIIGLGTAITVFIMYFTLENPDMEMIAELERAKKKAEAAQKEAIEAGKLEITESDYELYSLISDCYHMTADRAKKKDLDFTYTVEKSLPSRLCGDMFHIRQVVVNFLTNAIKYTDEGSISLAFSGERQDDLFFLAIDVKDTGIGLTKQSMDKLFTSFQRFDLSRNRSVEGTGLGLSISKQLTELMGGSVSVESEYQKGSVFRCRIPQKVVDDTPVGEISIGQITRPKDPEDNRFFTAKDARLLVVDDVEMNLFVFQGLLKGHAFTIDTALSGKQCLEMINEQKYDLIFMDHMMPEMDGMETFARMKETAHPNSDTPVIMLTANAISGEKEKYLAAGFDSYLTKPIQSDKLEKVLLHYLPKEKIVWEEAADAAANSRKAPTEDRPADREGSGLIDMTIGLQYSGEDEATYLTILESYLKDGNEKLEKIQTLYREESWKDYITMVHALKSTSLTIGAKQLSEMAKELEFAGKESHFDVIREKTDSLLLRYREVLDAGEKLLASRKQSLCGTDTESGRSAQDRAAETKKLQDIPKERLMEYRPRMKELLDRFDGSEFAAVCDELSVYSYNGTALEEVFAPAKAAAEDFEYEEAWELTDKIFTEM